MYLHRRSSQYLHLDVSEPQLSEPTVYRSATWIDNVCQIVSHCHYPWLTLLSCLPGSCKTHVVQAGDTCDIIAKANGISTADFFTFNPGVIKPGCTNINTGTNVCVDKPQGEQLVLPTCGEGTKPAIGRIAPGTDPKCSKADLYTVMPGDTCIKIVEEHGICLDEFYAQNKGVQKPSCSNLVPGDSYCVAKVKGTG